MHRLKGILIKGEQKLQWRGQQLELRIADEAEGLQLQEERRRAGTQAFKDREEQQAGRKLHVINESVVA